MKERFCIVLLDAPGIGSDPDRGAFLVRQVLLEAARIEAQGRLPSVRVFSIELSATRLALHVDVLGESALNRKADLGLAEVVWTGIAQRAWGVCS